MLKQIWCWIMTGHNYKTTEWLDYAEYKCCNCGKYKVEGVREDYD